MTPPGLHPKATHRQEIRTIYSSHATYYCIYQSRWHQEIVGSISTTHCFTSRARIERLGNIIILVASRFSTKIIVIRRNVVRILVTNITITIVMGIDCYTTDFGELSRCRMISWYQEIGTVVLTMNSHYEFAVLVFNNTTII